MLPKPNYSKETPVLASQNFVDRRVASGDRRASGLRRGDLHASNEVTAAKLPVGKFSMFTPMPASIRFAVRNAIEKKALRSSPT